MGRFELVDAEIRKLVALECEALLSLCSTEPWFSIRCNKAVAGHRTPKLYYARSIPRQFDGGWLMPETLKRESLRAFASEHRQEFEDLLRQFVEIPTVSVDPAHAADIATG